MAEEAIKAEEETNVSSEAETDADPFAELEEAGVAWGDGEETTPEDDSSEDEAESDEAEESSTDESSEDTEEESEEAEETQPPIKEIVEEKSKEDDSKESEEEVTASETEKPDEKKVAHEAFKRREAERKLREERESREKENLDRYLEEAKDDESLLKERKLEVQQFNMQKQQVNINAQSLDLGIRKAAAEIELLSTGSPEVKEAFAEALDDFYAMYVTRNKNGDPTEVKADVYQYLQKKADSIKKLTNIGAREQTKKKTAEKTRTVAKPTRTPKKPKSDPDLDFFDKEFYGE
jgi:hypothetical protein